MPSIWPQRRNPLEERILRRRRTPASALPGLGECNLLINDNDQSKLLYNDSSPPLRIDGGAFFAVPPGKSVATMVELIVSPNPETLSGLNRYDWFFRADGLRAWTWRTGSAAFSSFRQYDVSPAWGLAAGNWTNFGSPVLIAGGNARSFEWSPDGTVLLTSQRWFSSFYRLVSYDQSATPFDSSVLGAAKAFTNIISPIFNMRWKPDGTEVTLDSTGVYRTYSCPTPFDINTIVVPHIRFFDSQPDAGVRNNLAFSADGTKLYSTTSGNLLCEWTLSTPYDISTAGSFVTGVNVSLPQTLAIPRGMIVRPSTGDIFIEGDQGASSQRVKVFG